MAKTTDFSAVLKQESVRNGMSRRTNTPIKAELPDIPEAGNRVSASEVLRIEQQIIAVLPSLKSVEALEECRARSAALERYLRDKELQRPMLGAQRRIEARIGQLLGPPKRGMHSESVVTDSDIDKDDRSDFRTIALALGGKMGKPLTDDEWRKSRRSFVSLVRNRLGLIPETPPLPDGKFRCIVADPPWKLDTGPEVFNGTGERGHDSLEYEQMSVEDIKALPVEEHAADDCHLYLWTTNKYVEHSYAVVRMWGFKPSVLLVWSKAPRGVGLGDAFRLTTEFILYARRGSLKEREICNTTWFQWPRGKHSEKPEGFYGLVDRMCPARSKKERLEMFARKQREGWTSWGHEAKSIVET